MKSPTPPPSGEKELAYLRSIAISLKRQEIQRNRDLQKWSILKGFKDWHSCVWIAVQDQETKLLKELAQLEEGPYLRSTPQERITRIIDSVAGDHEIVRLDLVWLLARLERMEKALRDIEGCNHGEGNETIAIARSALSHGESRP
jgi:hypothetical protein